MVSIIGGPQSSGTSLLRQIINRHEDVVCLNESHLFCKKELYSNWSKARIKINSRGAFGLKSEGWKLFSGIDYQNNPDLNKMEVGKIARTSDSFQVFIDAVFDSLGQGDKSHYMDKTPANIFSFGNFLDTFDNSKVIVCLRDPYDIAASLVARRIKVLDAICLIKSAFISLVHLINSKDLLIVKYEELVQQPKEIAGKVCVHLGLTFQEKMLETSERDSSVVTQIEGWNYDEASAIGKGSIGRFLQMHNELKRKIEFAMLHVIWDNKDDEFIGICNLMGYTLHESTELTSYRKELKKQKTRSFIKRISYLHPFGSMKNPVSIR